MTSSMKPQLGDKDDLKMSSDASGFPFFLRLPRELANRIISLACRAPGPSIPAYENVSFRSPLALDVETTLSLAQVSKTINEVVNDILYHAVRITRPSALLELLRAVSSRPQLGKLIKNLHIGAEETLGGKSDWPLEMQDREDGEPLEYPTLQLRTSLSHPDEEEDHPTPLPEWCMPQQSWPLEPGRLDCEGSAVMAAIRAALDAIDVEPYRRGFARSGERIGLEEWAVRIYLLQACLDLFLMEMRRIERPGAHAYGPVRPSHTPHICRLGRCGHYPRLVFTASSRGGKGDPFAVTNTLGNTTFAVTRAQLWQHLTRRGGALDRFDHPIIFARTGLRAEHIADYGHVVIRSRLAGPHADHFTSGEYDPMHDELFDFSSEEDEEQGEDGNGILSQPQALSRAKTPKLAPAHTLQGLLDASRSLLRSTSQLLNLSMTGYLHLSICVPNPVFKTLRSLSLGPLLPYWNAAIIWGEKDGANSAALENLYLLGDILLEDEAEQIAGKDGRLPHLRRFVWELLSTNEPFPGWSIPANSIFDLICRLQGRYGAAQGTPRHIEVRLDAPSRSSVLDLATGQLRAAWQSRKASSSKQDGPHRIHVVESAAANVQLTQPEETAKKLHQNVREWWEDCAALAKHPDRQRPSNWMPNASGRCGVEPKRTGEEGEEEEEEEEERVAEAAHAM